MEVVTLDAFELGQLLVALGATQMGKLTPELRRKLQTAFKEARAPHMTQYDWHGNEVLPYDNYRLATDE